MQNSFISINLPFVFNKEQFEKITKLQNICPDETNHFFMDTKFGTI
jgi:hypothetical protein